VSLYIVEKMVSGVTVLDLRGRITLGEPTVALRTRVKQLVEAGRSRILLDLGQVDYIDSVGLSCLISSYATARSKGGALKLLHLTNHLRGLLQITRLITVFEVFDNLEEARKSFEEGGQSKVSSVGASPSAGEAASPNRPPRL
jgi:anti-sigma B factor antagonist